MSKKLKSVKKCLKHHQTTLEGHRIWFEDDWNESERSDFFCDFWIFGVFLGYFWDIFGVFEYVTKIGLYLETSLPEKKKDLNLVGL